MRLTTLHFLGALATIADATISTNYVLNCGGHVTYVDGGLYVKKDSSGNISGKLGGAVNGTLQFELNIAVTEPTDSTCCGPETYFLATEQVGTKTYRRHNLTPYIDVSPGAFAPLQFVENNSTLSSGDTTFGWMNVYGFVMWSPTGHLADVPPKPNADGSQTIHPSQGWQLVPTAITEIYQVYWNQTRFENDVLDGSSFSVGQCYGDYSYTNSPLVFVDGL